LLKLFFMLCIAVLMLSIGVLTAAGAADDSMGSWKSASWIWFPIGNPADTAPRGSVGFRKIISIPADKNISKADIGLAADDSFVLYINGQQIGVGSGWSKLSQFDLIPFVKPGKNLIAVEATNNFAGPAGLLARILITYNNGKHIELVSDNSWKSSIDVKPNWMSVDYDDGSWKKAIAAAQAGAGPWGEIAWMELPSESPVIPRDFPQFIVPGHEKEMASLRLLYWTSYKASRRPFYATPWDVWMVTPTLAVAPAPHKKGEPSICENWSKVLTDRYIGPDGYVSTQQHISHAHDLGWPFPLWPQIAVPSLTNGFTAGWHFNDELPAMMHDWAGVLQGSSMAGEGAIKAWTITQLESDGLVDGLWKLKSTGESSTITSPVGVTIDAFCAPFLQIRFSRTPKASDSRMCYFEWMREGDTDFSSERRIEFSPNGINPWSPGSTVRHCLIPMYSHPKWQGRIKRLRFALSPGETGVEYGIDSIFTAFDTRHPVNNSSYISGCVDYFRWTGDMEFIKKNITKIRTAMRFNLEELGGAENKFIKCNWVGHDGKPGYTLLPDGSREMHHGHGVGSNYWDILPIGYEDMYATNYYYHSLLDMAELEAAIKQHPKWSLSQSADFTSEYLISEAAAVKQKANNKFWNPDTGRFVACIDADGILHDYGYTFVNLEAITYGLASNSHAKTIIQWIDGKRTVAGDTSTGQDIYHWVFAPRASTKRNSDWYFWGWYGDTVPWGTQVQDGGAVLGFSYHDILSRLAVDGPDSAWKRCKIIADWYNDVMLAGGVRKYYSSSPGGATLQGGGTAGGLGIDNEFVETILAPYTIVAGFLGYHPRADGIEIKPRIPSDWPSLKVTQLRYRQATLSITACKNQIIIQCKGSVPEKIHLYLDRGSWNIRQESISCPLASFDKTVGLNGSIEVDLKNGNVITLSNI